MDTNTHILRAIEILGGVVKAASILKVGGFQTVQQWVKSGRVPAKYCPEIERSTAGAVRCEQLNPDINWGYLRNTQRKRRSAKAAA